MKTVELFCGTKSFSKEAEARGHSIFTVDLEKKFNPDICADIRLIDSNKLPQNPDILWASPPCTFFSVASIGKHWHPDHTPKTEEAKVGIELVMATLCLMSDLAPKFWFIENPRGKLRKLDVVKNLPYRKTVTYCQYGDTRMKPTDIWTNCDIEFKPICKNGDPCHIAAPRGSRTGTQGLKGNMERSRVPAELCIEILKYCEEKIAEGSK